MQSFATPGGMGRRIRATLAGAVLAAFASGVSADAITDWNQKSAELITESKLGTPPAIRVMALVQTAAYEAANAATQRHAAGRFAVAPARGASVEAAIAAAHRGTLGKLLPAQQALVEAAYQAALAPIADGPAKSAGIALGEQAAAAVLAARADDMPAGPDTYRPHTTAPMYVPTVPVAAPSWGQRKPWLLANAAQFRPSAPPALVSATWTRDYQEIKAIGSRASTTRTPEQTEVARFWEYSLPAIYHGVARSVAAQPGRDVTDNARLFAMVAQGMDDAMIAVFEAKYFYNFWRPVTAIRNGDLDGNDATERDAAWQPFSDNPMHPEYPSAHSILAATVGTVLKAEVGKRPMPVLATSSPSAKGATRQWKSVEDFMQEVAAARVYEGIHFRNSTEVGLAMGRKVGAVAVERFLGAAQ